ncbi:MAG: hypothetical protein ACRDLQ_02415 [Solirubrobacterales bacterium]
MVLHRYVTAVAALALSAAPAQAAAPEAVLEPVGAKTAVSAHDGHVVWNELDVPTGRWYLRHRFGGASARLPIAPRSAQFDVDVGPDRRGRAVAVYSRCAQEPAVAAGLALSPDWMTAGGCDIYQVDLATGKERRLRRVSSRRGSETTPSIWKRTIAFARRRPPRRTARIYLHRAGRARLVRVSGGTVPGCLRTCKPRPYGGPDALDLGSRSIAYLWRLVNGNVVGVGVGWELRSVRFGSRRAALLASGYVGGACGFALPSSPHAAGRGVIYLERVGECLTTRTSFVSFEPRTGRWRSGETLGGFGYALGRDGGSYYWLRGAQPEPENAPAFDPCRTGPAACVLVRSPEPAFGPPDRRTVAPPTL